MNDPELRGSLRKLAETVSSIRPPDGTEAAVLAEFDRIQRGRLQRARWGTIAGALAASLVIGTLLLRPVPHPAAQPETQAFLPIPYTTPLQPYERVLVVETSVPVRALIAAGFHVQTSDPAGSVRADVMVSQDGRPRAIRPVAFNLSDRSTIR